MQHHPSGNPITLLREGFGELVALRPPITRSLPFSKTYFEFEGSLEGNCPPRREGSKESLQGKVYPNIWGALSSKFGENMPGHYSGDRNYWPPNYGIQLNVSITK